MIQWLHPGLLGLAALAVPLIALYLLKARRQRRDVTAVWLWEAVQKDLEARVPLRRLRRDWLLWLQLLVLALLVLAAASPFRRALTGEGGTIAVVVDASASLLAEGRADELAAIVEGLIDGLGSGDRMTVIRAATRPEVLVPLTDQRGELLAAAQRARPAAIPTDLVPAVELAAGLVGDNGSVVVVTDSAAEVPAVGPDHRLQVFRLGENETPPENVGIVSLGVRPSDSSGHNHQVFVSLRNAAERPARGHLVLSVDGQVRDAMEIELAAGEEAGRTLALTETTLTETPGSSSSVIEVVWKTETPDALAADDRAFWVLQAPPERRYRILGSADPYLLRALVAIGADSSWSSEGQEAEPSDLDIVIGESPSAEGPPLLWIDPREGRRDAVEGAAVLSWVRTHPALRFVDLRAVRLGRVHHHIRPPGARVLAESSVGPMILEGQRGPRRYLMWAFDPMETDLPLRVAYPLLLRNALDHLVPAEGFLSGGRATGEALEVPWESPDAVTLTAPSGRQLAVTPGDGQLQLPPLEEVGVWSLQAETGPALRFATSLLSAEESDLGPGDEATLIRTSALADGEFRDTRARSHLRGLWRPLVLIALALLVLEAFAFHRRWTL